jgi:sugar lactone lactonase YvrE
MFGKHRLSAWRVLICGILAAVHAAAMAETRGDPAPARQVAAGNGWKYRVVAQNLPGVDNLVMDAEGSLYATQELSNGGGKVIRWHRGKIRTVVVGLNRPDGLLLHGHSLYITEEIEQGRVLEYNLVTKKQRSLATLNRPEGIDLLPDGDLVVAEDSISGRLVRVSRHGHRPVEVILGGLNRPEGVAVNPDGAVIFAETETGRVLSYKEGDVTVVVDDLDEPDQVEFAPDGALWITEDVKNARLLRLKNGALETVLSGLRQPQGMAFGADGTVWLAEQGRHRLLAITRDTAR